MTTKNELSIEHLPVSVIRPYEGSPRLHSRAQRRKAAHITKQFGQLRPILIDSENCIIDGHLIFDCLREAGYDQVAAIVVDRDPASIKAIRLALNRLPQDSRWHDARLRKELDELIDLGYDMTLTGFDQVEIDMSLSFDEGPSAGAIEDPVPEPNRAHPAIAKAGDLWQLGQHFLACGDSRDPKVMSALFGTELAEMIFTDPPFNVKIAGNVSGLGKHTHREFAMASGEMSQTEFIEFLTTTCGAAVSCLMDGGIAYYCIDWRHLNDLVTAAATNGLRQLNLIVWNKTNAAMGTFYRSQHELIPVFKKGEAPHINNFELGKKGRSRSNVWTYRGMNVPGAERDELLAMHPTVKPLAMVIDAIKDVSRRGAIVLDPFLGSGTTLIAAEVTGRRCYGCEIDPHYVDLCIQRWQDHTDEVAIHIPTGATFDSFRDGRDTRTPLLSVVTSEQEG